MEQLNEKLAQKYSGLLAQANHDKIMMEIRIEELEEELEQKQNELEELKEKGNEEVIELEGLED